MSREAYYRALDKVIEIFDDCVKYGTDYDGIEELLDIEGITPEILYGIGDRIEDIGYWINKVASKLEESEKEEEEEEEN